MGVDIRLQDRYSKLTEAQKTFAKKMYDENPQLRRQVESGVRIPEQEIIKDISQMSQEKNNTRVLRIVTVGDDRVCEKCAKWNGKIVSLDGSSSPTLDDAIKDGFLHFGCRCAL